MSETVVEFTHQQVWEALDEVDSTGEFGVEGGEHDERLLAHLKERNLVEYDEVDCVLFISDAGWEVYEKGWSAC